MNNPTIVSAALSDKELQDSINKMVANFDEGLRKMLDHSNEYVGKIQASLQKIGDTNFGAKGSNDGGVAKQTKAQKEATNETERRLKKEKEVNLTLDQQAAIMGRIPKEMRTPDMAKSARDSFAAFYKGFNEQARQIEPLIKSWESLLQARHNNGIEQVAQQIRNVKHEIAEIIKKQAELSRTKPQGYMDAIAKMNPQIKALREQIVALEAEEKRLKAVDPFKNNPYLDALREKLYAINNAMRDTETTSRKLIQTTDSLTEAQKKAADEQMKLFYARTMKIPTDQYDMQIAKLERIQSMLDRYRRGEASFTPSQVSGLEKEERNLLQLINQVKQEQQGVTQSTVQTTQATQRLVVVSEKESKALQEQKEHLALIRDIAREAREDISRFGRANITNYKGTVYAENDARAKGLTVEQQIEKIITEENAARNERVNIERQITQEVEKQKKEYVAPSSYSTPMTSSLLRGFVGDKLGLTADKLVTSDAASSIKTVNAEMKQLQETYQKMTDAERTSPFGTQLRQRFQELQRQSQQLNAQLSRPVSLKDALKGSEKTLDDLAAKIRRLQSYMQGLDTSTEKSAQEFQRAAMHVALLKEKQNELLNKNSQLIRSNNELFKSNTALGRSWNYMKNRLAFYFTVGASTQFVKNLIEVRSQYEMNERALGILVNSAERGSQIFNELSQMALVSPYTLIELSAAAKQLTAYDVAAKDVVDTTRRLADMASAVGIPIERLTYALGQIKAYGYLNSRDARMFANAGIPLVKQLSDYYTELEGKLVSTADIYDRIKKKAIGYNDVMQVVNKMTDEGGKFFDFQAKMADTLKVQLANLTLAWNNLLNDIGSETRGVLTFGIGALKSLFLAWKDVSNVLGSVVIAFGGYKAIQMLANVVIGKATRQTLKYVEANKLATWQEYHRALSIRGLTKDQARWLLLTNQSNKALVAAVMRMGVLDAATVRYIASLNGLKKGFAMLLLGGKMAIIGLGKAFKSLGLALASNLPLLAIMGAVSIWQNLSENAEKIKKINEDIVNNAKESSKNIGEFLQRNIDLYKSLYEWGGESGKEIVGTKDIGRAEAAKAWEAIREEIETSSQASKIFVRELLDIGDINERVRKGFDYAKQIQAATSAMQELGEESVKVTSDVAWGIFGEGLKSDLQDYLEGLKGASIFDGSSASNPVFKGLEREFLGELHETTNSIAAEIERLNLTPIGAQEAFARMADAIIQSEGMTAAQSEVFRIALEKDFTDVQRKMLEVKKLVALSPEERAAIQERIDAFDKAFGGTNKAALEAFFTWVRNGYSHLFDGMTEEELKNINLQDEKYADLWRNYEKNFKRYHYSAYKELGDSVKEISTWSINIPVFFNVHDSSSDSVLDKWTKADKDLKDAKEKVDRLSRGISQLKKGTQEYTAAQEELNSARQDEADARSRGGLDKEKKGGGSKKDVVLESLKQEIDLVKKLQGEYDKLTQKGATHADALSTVQSAYGKTLSLINQRLRKMGLSELNLSIVTGKDPNMQLEHFKKTLEEMERKGLLTTERSKAVEAVIQELTVSAKTYNLDKLTKGLNSELDKLKDEYELALELDANPEMGNMFLDMFDIDANALPQTIDQYAARVLDALNKSFEERKTDFRLPTLDLTRDDVESYRQQVADGVLDQTTFDLIEKYYKAIRDLREKDAKDTLKRTQELQYKLADVNGKIAIETEKLEHLRQKLAKETSEEKKRLLELEIQEQEQVIDKLREDILQMLPTYKALFGGIAEHSANMTRKIGLQLRKMLENATLNADGSYTVTDPQNGSTARISRRTREAQLDKVNKEILKTQSSFKKIKEAVTAGEDGMTDWAMAVELIGDEAKKAADGLNTISDILEALGASDDTVETLRDIASTIEGISTAAQGVAQINSGDVIGGTTNVIKGTWTAVSSWLDNKNKKITRRVEESRRAVSRLQNAYEELEYSIEHSMGAAEIGARRAAVENKKLQLAELERQLTLEKSRKKKDQDENAIIELEGQVAAARRELNDLTNGVVEMLTGSDIKSAAEEFVDAWVQAWKAGETTLDAIEDKMDGMIENLIKKGVTSQIVGTILDPLYKDIKKYASEGSEGGEELTINELRQLATSAGVTAAEINTALGAFYGNLEQLGILSKTQEASKELSSLQQGIQSITEDTAGALEAITSGMSQQVYYQSTLLEQIRDSVAGLDLDVSLGVQSQMLLQLQNSYQTQQAIQQILEGVLVPSGRAFAVELLS